MTLHALDCYQALCGVPAVNASDQTIVGTK
jgi:hypothetical protein